MKYFMFRLEWSQTDHENVIVEDASREDALLKLQSKWPDSERGPRYFSYVGMAETIIE